MDYVTVKKNIIGFIECKYKLDITIKDRLQERVDLRYMYFYIIKNYFGSLLSLSFIAKDLNDYDHATVIHALKEVEKQLRNDKIYKSKFDQINNYIKYLSFKIEEEQYNNIYKQINK